MKSSAVNARISETVDAMRRPVAIYGAALGNVMRASRSKRPTPNERAVSIATGSTSRTPYIVWTSSGQNAPKAARKTSLLTFVPIVRKSTGISAADGIGRRNSIGTRNAAPASSLEPSTIPIGIASTAAMSSPRNQPRTVSANDHQKWLVCTIDQSSLKVVVIAGSSRCEITPGREISSQKRRADTIETTNTNGSTALMSRRSRVAASGLATSTSPDAMCSSVEADARGNLARGGDQSGREALEQLVHRDERAVHRDVDGSDHVARLRPHGRGDRAQAVSELLVVHREPRLAHALELLEQLALRRDRVRAAARQARAVEQRVPVVRRQEREQHLAHRRAVRGESRADVQVEVDLPRPGRPAAFDVNDVAAVEHGHVDGVAGGVAESLEMRRRDVAQLHRVDRREAEVEHARAEPVLARVRVLLQVPERGERRHVAVRRRAAQSDDAGEVADAEERLRGLEGRQNGEAPLQ